MQIFGKIAEKWDCICQKSYYFVDDVICRIWRHHEVITIL